MRTKGGFNTVGFSRITRRRRCAVRIDVVHLFCVHARIFQRQLHTATCTGAVRRRRGHVVGIGVHCHTADFGIYFCATGTRVLQLFDHHHSGAITEDKTITLLVPWAAGCLRVVVTCGQGPGSGETANTDRRRGILGTTGDHGVNCAVLNHTHGIADVVRAGAASRDDRNIRPLVSIHDGEVAGNHIDDCRRNEKRRDAARPLFEESGVIVLNGVDAADTGANRYANTLGVLLCCLQTGILYCLDTGRHAVMDKGIHLARLFQRDVFSDIEIFDGAAETHTEFGNIEAGNRTDTAFSCENTLPGCFHIISHRCDQAKTCHHYPAFRHVECTSFMNRHAACCCNAIYSKGR